jgi:hypothetical protein
MVVIGAMQTNERKYIGISSLDWKLIVMTAAIVTTFWVQLGEIKTNLARLDQKLEDHIDIKYTATAFSIGDPISTRLILNDL